MSECANEYRRQRDELFQALKDALKVIDGICNEECSDYGFGDEIDRLRMISENKKPCRFCDRPQGSRHSRPYCTKHQTFCEPGYYPDCEKETTLYPHHEKETEMNTPKTRLKELLADMRRTDTGVLLKPEVRQALHEILVGWADKLEETYAREYMWLEDRFRKWTAGAVSIPLSRPEKARRAIESVSRFIKDSPEGMSPSECRAVAEKLDEVLALPYRNCDRFDNVPGDAVGDFLKKHPNANFSGTDQHAISVFALWVLSAADKEDPSCR